MDLAKLEIISSGFSEGDMIPKKYTADGENVNPQLEIIGIPSNAKSLVLIIDDPDAPYGTWTHWIVFNISPDKTAIEENSVPGIQGVNDFRKIEYSGPSPPIGKHRYFFKIFALDRELNLGGGALLGDVEKAMKGRVVGAGKLMGFYER